MAAKEYVSAPGATKGSLFDWWMDHIRGGTSVQLNESPVALTEGESSAFFLIDEVQGFLYSAALRVAAAVGVADHLAGGPTTVPALAQKTGVDAENLRRVLRLL